MKQRNAVECALRRERLRRQIALSCVPTKQASLKQVVTAQPAVEPQETLMLLPHGTVIAVVDGEKLDLYRNSGTDTAPELARVDAPELAEHGRDAGGRHMSSAANPGHQLDEDSHAAAVTDWLNKQVSGHKIANLVIVAAPRTLGEMRRRYDKALEAVLVGELTKELTGRSGSEILAALERNSV
jgi:protein required for attachment to host cells